MGRKPKPGLRETILAQAAERASSASMIQAALEAKYGPASTSLTGVIKAAEGLRLAGLLRAAQLMPEVYRGARPRTYYRATPKGKASLRDAIASATADWNPPAKNTAKRRTPSCTDGANDQIKRKLDHK